MQYPNHLSFCHSSTQTLPATSSPARSKIPLLSRWDIQLVLRKRWWHRLNFNPQVMIPSDTHFTFQNPVHRSFSPKIITTPFPILSTHWQNSLDPSGLQEYISASSLPLPHNIPIFDIHIDSIMTSMFTAASIDRLLASLSSLPSIAYIWIQKLISTALKLIKWQTVNGLRLGVHHSNSRPIDLRRFR